MNTLTKYDVNKLTAKELKDRLPFLVSSDGETIAAVIPYVNKLEHEQTPKYKPSHDVNELPLSKKKQAEGHMASI